MQEIVDLIVQTLLVPAVLALSGYLLIIIKSYAERVVKSVTERNEVASLNTITEIRGATRSQIDMVVEAVVYGQMKNAHQAKLNNYATNGSAKLSEEDVKHLLTNAHMEVARCLPNGVIKPDCNIIQLLGGVDIYTKLVEHLIEKHVSEYKIKSNGG